MTDLAEKFNTSLFATGSRMIAFSSEPCAFVVSQGGKIKYAFRSSPLRDAKLWVPSGIMLPDRSRSAALRKGATGGDPIELDADEWLDNVEGGVVLEDAIYDASRDQTLTLLRLDIEDMPQKAESTMYARQEDDEGLKELDGHLAWPSKR